MGEQQHTPGPWRIHGDLTRRTLKGANDRSIIVIERWTNEPDARLIAAAPDMLEALQEFYEADDEVSMTVGAHRAAQDRAINRLIEARKRACTAIAKATGAA